MRENFFETPWNKEVPKADIIVLNRGAHYEPDDVTIRDFEKALAFVRRKNPRAVVIVRNTPGGELRCVCVTNCVCSICDTHRGVRHSQLRIACILHTFFQLV